MKILFILNHPPYGTEHCYNALRLAQALLKQADTEVTVFFDGRRRDCRYCWPENV